MRRVLNEIIPEIEYLEDEKAQQTLECFLLLGISIACSFIALGGAFSCFSNYRFLYSIVSVFPPLVTFYLGLKDYRRIFRINERLQHLFHLQVAYRLAGDTLPDPLRGKQFLRLIQPL